MAIEASDQRQPAPAASASDPPHEQPAGQAVGRGGEDVGQADQLQVGLDRPWASRLKSAGPAGSTSGRRTSSACRAAASGSSLERVELDGQPAVVAGLADRRDDLGEVDRARAGDQVVMDPGGGDVLEVVMADVRGQLGDRARAGPRSRRRRGRRRSSGRSTGRSTRSATSRYWSVVSSSRPGSGSIRSRTPHVRGRARPAA